MDFQQAIKAYAKMMDVSESEAKRDAEATIKMWMEQDGMSREFAENSWIEEQEDFSEAELAEMTKKAKDSGIKAKAHKPANYSLEGKPKRERKANDEKRDLIAYVAHAMGECDHFDENFAQTVEILNPEREITFKVGENCYSLTLTCHRKPKK
jgi:hypothetical protein